MPKRNNMLLILFILIAVVISGCSQSEPIDSGIEQDQIELTLEELSKYNGEDGMPSYIAVDGVIYDVSDSSNWRNGMHNGYEAGNDLTDEIKNKSPHGVSKLKSVPVVGSIIEN
jgi:predicted heme/steroid binding protein